MSRQWYFGNSMRRIFQDGDEIISRPAAFASLRPGDVVVFVSEKSDARKQQVIHRVIWRNTRFLVTIGDNNPRVDRPFLTPQASLRRAILVRRNGMVFPIRNGWCGFLGFLAFRFGRLLTDAAARLLRPLLAMRLDCLRLKPEEQECFGETGISLAWR